MWIKRRFALMAPAEDGASGAGGSGAASPAPAPAGSDGGGAPAPAPATGNTSTLLGQGDSDWLPEKFRVSGEDGQLDVGASARKLAQSYTELERNRPSGTVPDDPDGYAPEGLPEELNFDEIKGDPLYQGFLKGAHSKGLTNDQVSYVLGQYFELMPSLNGEMNRMSADDARIELGKLWKSDQDMQSNLSQASRAVRGFGGEGDIPGGVDRLMAKYGNDPDFLAFAAAIGAEMAEDTPITSGTAQAEDWDGQVAKLKADPAYTDARHPEHTVVMNKLNALYAKRYGTKTQRLGGATIR